MASNLNNKLGTKLRISIAIMRLKQASNSNFDSKPETMLHIRIATTIQETKFQFWKRKIYITKKTKNPMVLIDLPDSADS